MEIIRFSVSLYQQRLLNGKCVQLIQPMLLKWELIYWKTLLQVVVLNYLIFFNQLNKCMISNISHGLIKNHGLVFVKLVYINLLSISNKMRINKTWPLISSMKLLLYLNLLKILKKLMILIKILNNKNLDSLLHGIEIKFTFQENSELCRWR